MRVIRSIAMCALGVLAMGCASARPALQVELSSHEDPAQAARPAPLQQDHFRADEVAGLGEEALREILRAPVFLEEGARVGVVPVRSAYHLDAALPLEPVTGVLHEALRTSGLFAGVSEVSTEWPCGRGVSGLRELAARYRADYLLLYRHRFVDRQYTNAWGWAWLTLVGGFFAPSETVESAGVLEATWFDVRTGTLLFTSYARTSGRRDASVVTSDEALRELQADQLEEAASVLAGGVLDELRDLVTAREQPSDQARVSVR